MKLITKIALPILAVLALANALLLFVHRVMTNGDNLDYLFIAGSVLHGDWAEPFLWRFPVGYPFLLAGYSWLAGIAINPDPLTVSTSGLYTLQMLGVLMAPLSLLAVWGWGRHLSPGPHRALAVAALWATSQQVAPVYSIIGAEPFFILFSWLALGAWEKGWTLEGRTARHHLLLAAAYTLLAILFRQIGLAIALASLGALVLTGRRLARPQQVWMAGCAGGVLLTGLLLMLFSNPSHLHQLSSGTAEKAGLTDFISAKIALLGHNALVYRMMLPEMLLPKVFGETGLLAITGCAFLQVPLALLVYGVFLVGWLDVLRCRAAGTLTALYVAISLAIFLVWPYTDGRFFVPLIPAFWMFAITGLARLAGMLAVKEQSWTRVGYLAVGLLLSWQLVTNIFAGGKNVKAIRHFAALPAWHPDRYQQTGELDFADHLACGLWLAQHAEPEAVVYGEKASFLALASGRRSFYLGSLLNAGKSGEDVAGRETYYVVVDVFPATSGYGRVKQGLEPWLALQENALVETVYEGAQGARILKRTPRTAWPAATP
jgi:hypothetical protein